MIGQTISHYEILEKLGRGGMGIVYKALDTKLKRTVALKFLPSHLSADEDAKQRFIQEAQAASALDHANICTIYEIGETEPGEGQESGGEVYIAMAFYEGQTLKYRLESEEFSVERAADIARQLASGLGRAHEQGIVHRDVKPANIMLTDRDEVKLLDFGLAKLIGGADLTAAGSTLGTAAYMSPEQVRGDEVTPASDVWSVGVVLYEMLAGRRPFSGDYDQAAMYAILNESPEHVAAVNPDVPDSLNELVACCLEKEESKRPPTAREVAAAIVDSGLASGSGTLRSVSVPAARPVAARPKWLVPALGAFVVVVIGLSAMLLIGRGGSAVEPEPVTTPDPAIAVLPFSVGGDESLDYLRNGMVRLLSTRFDGMGELRSIDPNALLAQSEIKVTDEIDPASGVNLARRFNAANFVMGSVLRIGGPIQISATLYSLDGASQAYAEATIPSDSLLLSAVDDIAKKLLAGKFEGQSESLSLAVLNTSSFEALRLYLEGEEIMHEGRFREARPKFEEAVALDSTFALAWLRMSESMGWSNWGDPMYEKGFAAAQRHGSRLPERVREQMEITLLLRSGQFREGVRRLEQMVARHPDDIRAVLILGDYKWHYNAFYGQPANEADDYFRRLLAIDPTVAEARVHLQRSAAAAGRLAEADSLARMLNWKAQPIATDFLRKENEGLLTTDYVLQTVEESGADVVRRSLGVLINDLSVPPLARKVLAAIPENEQNDGTKRWIELQGGRYGDVMTDLADLDTLGRWFDVAYAMPFYPFDGEQLRQIKGAMARVDTVAEGLFSPDSAIVMSNFWVWPFVSAALVEWRQGDDAALERRRTQLEARSSGEPTNNLPLAYSHVVRALQLWREGRIDAAEQAFDQSIIPVTIRLTTWPFFDFSMSRFLRAQMLYEAGRYEDALRWFTAVDDGFLHFSNGNRLRAPSAYRKAQIYEQLGDSEQAISHYRKFVRMWEEADPVLQPMVDDARKRIDALAATTAREPGA